MPIAVLAPTAPRARTGHTLIELVVATTLLAVGLLAVAALTALAARRAGLAHDRSAVLDSVRGGVAAATARTCADTTAPAAGWTIVASPRRTRMVSVRTSWRGLAGDEPLLLSTEAPCRD